MWKLTVEKLNENETGGYEYATDKVNFQAETVEQLVDVMETFQMFGVGKFRYLLIEEKGEKQDEQSYLYRRRIWLRQNDIDEKS